VRLVRALDRHHRVTMVPFQQPGVAEQAGLTLAQCEAAAWAITPRGGRYRGAGAINAALSVALGCGLPLWLYSLPGLQQLQDVVYALIAKYRSRLPGDQPYCQAYPERCR
jgi:predicted DCC family thiol-disulfide oxidoreductase YuxK